ncbi:DUF2058 domain-containing protein [Marinobacterium arenosum]|uniref:DUF2058 domain-containing protein n=1 Tax=Marinobacterium arenosum TaxID=2862496 RepID=UPI001C97BD64|nr:DUF2058 family protein [Marinobacterium arenosum]MBY4675456.1 DUF2058 domain-containing protein [Marinobacterium arenosum]
MAGSLQDQLLNMGVASKKQAQQAKQQKRKKAKQAKGGAAPVADQQDSQAQLAKARAEKQQRDRELNRQREAEKQQRAQAAQARQLVEQHGKPVPEEGPVDYNFVHGKVIKTLHVDRKQLEMLAAGTLAVAFLDDKYWLLAGDVAERVAAVSGELIASHHQKQEPDEDDPYKDYQIPDDLMW